MRRKNIKISAILYALMLLSSSAFLQSLPLSSIDMPVAEAISPQPSPKDVVEKFCEMDAKGQRVRGDTWRQNVAPLVTWPEEAGDMIFVIVGYEVGKAEILNSKARVSVKYRYLGSTNFIDFSSPGKDLRQERIVVFELARIDGTWKIKGPITAPHVNWKVVIADLKALQHEEPQRKEQIGILIKKIEKAAKGSRQ